MRLDCVFCCLCHTLDRHGASIVSLWKGKGDRLTAIYVPVWLQNFILEQ